MTCTWCHTRDADVGRDLCLPCLASVPATNAQPTVRELRPGMWEAVFLLLVQPGNPPLRLEGRGATADAARLDLADQLAGLERMIGDET